MRIRKLEQGSRLSEQHRSNDSMLETAPERIPLLHHLAIPSLAIAKAQSFEEAKEKSVSNFLWPWIQVIYVPLRSLIYVFFDAFAL